MGRRKGEPGDPPNSWRRCRTTHPRVVFYGRFLPWGLCAAVSFFCVSPHVGMALGGGPQEEDPPSHPDPGRTPPPQARVGAGWQRLRKVFLTPLSGVGLSVSPPRDRSRWFRFFGLFPGAGGGLKKRPRRPSRGREEPRRLPAPIQGWRGVAAASGILPNPSFRGWSVGLSPPGGRSRRFRFLGLSPLVLLGTFSFLIAIHQFPGS